MIRARRRLGSVPSGPCYERRMPVGGPLLTGLEIASAACAGATGLFVLAVQFLWRRGKSLREP